MSFPPERLAKFQDENGEWLPPNKWPHVDLIATCKTPGCPVEGVSFDVRLAENVDGSYICECAQCGHLNELTDSRGVKKPNGVPIYFPE